VSLSWKLLRPRAAIDDVIPEKAITSAPTMLIAPPFSLKNAKPNRKLYATSKYASPAATMTFVHL
jgi:hypothetical protein